MLFEWRYCSPCKYNVETDLDLPSLFYLADLSQVETAVRLQQLIFLVHDPLKQFTAFQILQHQNGFSSAIEGFHKSEHFRVKSDIYFGFRLQLT